MQGIGVDRMSEEIKEITISMEEHKELLMIKGRYEELSAKEK